MAGASGAALSAAVARAGGLGFLGSGFSDAAWIQRWVSTNHCSDVSLGPVASTLLQMRRGSINRREDVHFTPRLSSLARSVPRDAK